MKNQNLKLFGLTLLILFLPGEYLLGSNDQLEANPLAATEGEDDLSSWVWLPPEVITTESTDTSILSDAYMDHKGNIHVVWSDITDYQTAGTDMDIFYKKWNANSRLWSVTEVVTPESSEWILSGFPSVRVDSKENVYVTWEDTYEFAESGPDYDIFLKIYNKTLEYWMAIEVVSIESDDHSQYHFLEIDEDDNLHIVWADKLDIASEGPDSDIYYKCRNASTGEWSDPEVVSLQSIASTIYPTLTIDSKGYIHVVWLDFTDTDLDAELDVFYSFKNGSIWSVDQLISVDTTLGAERPAIDCDKDDNIHVAWSDETDYGGAQSDFDIFYTYLDFTSKLWFPTAVVSTESTADSITPSLVCDGDGLVHFVWGDSTNYRNSGTDSDIFYKYFNPSSKLWTPTAVISPYSIHVSTSQPIIIEGSESLHCLWNDKTPLYESGDDIDIHYCKFIGSPGIPRIYPIQPNPNKKTDVSLDWNDCVRSLSYYVYRSTEIFASTDNLDPIAICTESAYTDQTPGDGTYYYAVVAANYDLNSTMSNIEEVIVDKFYLSVGLKELIFIITGAAVLLVINGFVVYWITSKRTQKLLANFATNADRTNKSEGESKSEQQLKAISDILKEK